MRAAHSGGPQLKLRQRLAFRLRPKKCADDAQQASPTAKCGEQGPEVPGRSHVSQDKGHDRPCNKADAHTPSNSCSSGRCREELRQIGDEVAELATA